MIIRIITIALIQCTTRTQAGWITSVGAATARSPLAVMLDMAVPPEFAPDYTRKSPFRYCDTTYQVDRSGLSRSQKSEQKYHQAANSAVILRSRALPRRLEGGPRAPTPTAILRGSPLR